MKKIKIYLVIIITLIVSNLSNAQTLNWSTLNEKKNILNVNFGIEYGTIYGLGYSHVFRKKRLPIIAQFEYSFPSGNKFFDDYKIKTGVNIRWIEFNKFQFSTRVDGIFRRYNNSFARIINFGSDVSATFGYYKPKWFVATEIGFDKAIISHFKHTQIYKNQFPGAVDGWYEPSMGGNFYYGIQGGISFSHNDLYLKAGKIVSQDFKTLPMIPLFAQIGYNFKF